MSELSHYFDVKAIPQADITQSQVISHIMQLLHQLLPKFNGKIGLSFPAYGQQKTLGGIIRLLGGEKDISAINQEALLLNSMKDYALIGAVIPIPETVNSYAYFSRLHHKGASHIRRSQKRLTERGEWSDEIAENMLAKYMKQKNYPHVHLKSSTTGQNWILQIKRQQTNLPSNKGMFNSFGLSTQLTVPLF
ncbi:type I-F CRISPR-associated endoribonuclease Cas6/Csy4 [Advenella alkanexedens]|uniref:Type I-F CRISPR-associated endoribonuclease Cas6/Csy4 n=1 Tax=Advenella alkanexedens TaxID=1481665 RepID=A0ABS6NN95_9BURK|nr:type I-F CRISPR-associated endoribonuclease Cas6/Csy4 [Advenella alkanexedens]MBV4397107.1 type I-F CRISPR-associated endoribonuclease Cas6/Csy4 [Advenella alkanexedens]